MITIISGTNRKDNMSSRVAAVYAGLLKKRDINYHLLSLEDLPKDFLRASLFHDVSKAPDFEQLQEKYLIPADKFIFVMPEYNGSIPGILKLLIDSVDIKKVFYHKKAMLTGISSGRAGNLRGLDHLTNILNYLKVSVYHNKLPISRINEELDERGFKAALTRRVVEDQLAGFIDF